LFQTIDEGRKSRIELDPRQLGPHPLHSIDLGELLVAHREEARDQGVDVVVALDCPSDNDLAGLHRHVAEGDPRRGWSGPAGLLFEFTGSRRFIVLARFHHPFDDRPPAIVATCEIGPAGVGDEHFDAVMPAEGKKTRGSHRGRHYAGPVTLLAAQPAAMDSVVLHLPAFRLHPGEPLGVGLQRLSLLEMEIAVSGFYDGEEAFGEAVHIARKSTKKIRALLRLVRSEIGEKVYRFENESMRDTARLLSGVRSAAVMANALDDLQVLYGSLLADGTFEEARERLAVNRERVEARAMEDPELVPRIVANLERAHSRYASWPTDSHAREVYGTGIRDTYSTIGPGLKATYRRGRSQMVMAYRAPSPTTFHRWRKRVKYLKHQMEIITPLWPEVILGMVITLDRMAELLGEDHDLAELLESLTDRPELCPNPMERSLLRALVEQRRSDVETASRILGRRIYAESPAGLKGRFGAYWDSMELARGVALAVNGRESAFPRSG
jgi:CHAD domain-containing protein